jgi:hypothetical protein
MLMRNDTRRYRGARLLYFSISPRYSNVYLSHSRCSVNIENIVCDSSYAKNTQSISPLTLRRPSLAPFPLKKASFHPPPPPHPVSLLIQSFTSTAPETLRSLKLRGVKLYWLRKVSMAAVESNRQT